MFAQTNLLAAAVCIAKVDNVFWYFLFKIAMDFDLVLEEIGEFGKFQLTNYLLICLPVLYGAANSLTYVFNARSPNYRFVKIYQMPKGSIKFSQLHALQVLDSRVWFSGKCKVWRRVGHARFTRIDIAESWSLCAGELLQVRLQKRLFAASRWILPGALVWSRGEGQVRQVGVW